MKEINKNGKLATMILSVVTLATVFIPGWFKSEIFSKSYYSLANVFVYLGKAIYSTYIKGVNIMSALADKGLEFLTQMTGFTSSADIAKLQEQYEDKRIARSFKQVMDSAEGAKVAIFAILAISLIVVIYLHIKATKAMLNNNPFATDYAKRASIGSIAFGIIYLLMYFTTFTYTYVQYDTGLSKVGRFFEKVFHRPDLSLTTSSFLQIGFLPLIFIALGLIQLLIVHKFRVWNKEAK